MILDTHVRAEAGVNALEGVGMIEAPRGTLIHHYKVDENGAIAWANLIVATGHNNHAIGDSVGQVSEHFIRDGHPGRHVESRFRGGARLRSVPAVRPTRSAPRRCKSSCSDRTVNCSTCANAERYPPGRVSHS